MDLSEKDRVYEECERIGFDEVVIKLTVPVSVIGPEWGGNPERERFGRQWLLETRLRMENQREEKAELARAEMLGKIHSIERQMPPAPKPEWRMWSPWIAVFALIVAILALFRDYVDLRRSPEPKSSDPSSEVYPLQPEAKETSTL